MTRGTSSNVLRVCMCLLHSQKVLLTVLKADDDLEPISFEEVDRDTMMPVSLWPGLSVTQASCFETAVTTKSNICVSYSFHSVSFVFTSYSPLDSDDVYGKK